MNIRITMGYQEEEQSFWEAVGEAEQQLLSVQSTLKEYESLEHMDAQQQREYNAVKAVELSLQNLLGLTKKKESMVDYW